MNARRMFPKGSKMIYFEWDKNTPRPEADIAKVKKEFKHPVEFATRGDDTGMSHDTVVVAEKGTTLRAASELWERYNSCC